MSYYKRGGMTRRELLKWATITGTGLALASCGAAATPTAAPATGGGKPTGAINYWHHFTSDSEMKGLEKITANFKTKYPEVTLTQENIPNKDYMAKFTSAVQANTRPDTAMVSADRVVDMVAMNGLTDLTTRINAWDGKKDFPDNRWTLGTVNGKIYGIPGFMFVNWLYYRPDFFQEAGISGPPKTWAEFGDAAAKLTNPSKNRFGFGMRGGDGGEGFVLTVFRAWGSSLVDDKGKPAIDAAKATEALKFYVELFTKAKAAPPSAPSDSYAQIMNAFKTGQTAMVMHHTGSLKEIKDALGDKFATAPMPAGPAARIADVTPLYNGIMKNDKIDAAWAWVTQWGQADSSIALLEETGYFPASTSVAADKRITENPIYKAAIETLGYGTQAPQFNGNAAWQKQTVLPAFQKALLGQATPEQAVNEMIEGLKKATA